MTPDFHPLFLHAGRENAGFVAAVRHAADRLAGVLRTAAGPYSGLNPDELWQRIRASTAATGDEKGNPCKKAVAA